MAETLMRYQHAIAGPDGELYEARAVGSRMSGGKWQAWIEFVPLDGGKPLRTARETTQPNRDDAVYWATGLSPVYLEGALRRALEGPPEIVIDEPPPPMFSAPAPSTSVTTHPGNAAVLDPFSVYEKGEALLRRQLSALSAWHLVNIITAYELSDAGAATLSSLPPAALIDIIVSGVRKEREAVQRRS
jgi:hypothetical protein